MSLMIPSCCHPGCQYMSTFHTRYSPVPSCMSVAGGAIPSCSRCHRLRSWFYVFAHPPANHNPRLYPRRITRKKTRCEWSFSHVMHTHCYSTNYFTFPVWHLDSIANPPNLYDRIQQKWGQDLHAWMQAFHSSYQQLLLAPVHAPVKIGSAVCPKCHRAMFL